MTFTNIRTRSLPDDRLLIRGTLEGAQDENGNPFTIVAFGWQSALTNHYDPHSGPIRPDSLKPRHMTPEEEQSYYTQLLTNAVPPSFDEEATE